MIVCITVTTGGYTYDDISKCHHITVPAILEAEPEENHYMLIDLYGERVLARGEGEIEVNPGLLLGESSSWLRLSMSKAIDLMHLSDDLAQTNEAIGINVSTST